MRRTSFATFAQGERTQEVGRGGHGDQRRSFGEGRGARCNIDAYKGI